MREQGRHVQDSREGSALWVVQEVHARAATCEGCGGWGVSEHTCVAAGYLAGFRPSHPVGTCRGCETEEIWELPRVPGAIHHQDEEARLTVCCCRCEQFPFQDLGSGGPLGSLTQTLALLL